MNDFRTVQEKVKAAFDVFDKEGKGCVIVEYIYSFLIFNREIGTIMRSLNVFPPELEISEKIIPEMQGDEVTPYVTYAAFEKKMLELLRNHQYLPDTTDSLMNAFQSIDLERKGYISVEDMKNYMTSMGTPFRDTEIEAFLAVAKDPKSDNIYYEDYISLFAKEVLNTMTQ